MSRKKRIDLLLVENGLAESRSQAQRLIMAGQVRLAGEVVHKPSQQAEPNSALTVDKPPRYVSRGGEKLEAALKAFNLTVQDYVCADVGASTGGFTDCLLQRGALRVYAIDVGHGELSWKLREDRRVIVLERTNARELADLPEPIDLATVDVSFISLRLILPRIRSWLSSEGEIVALVKPQFEVGKGQVPRGGVVRSDAVHRQVLEQILEFCVALELAPGGLIRSPLLGQKGNAEFLLWLRPVSDPTPVDPLIDNLFSPPPR